MATKRITMRKIREVLRLHFAAQLSVRKISASTKISVDCTPLLVSMRKRKLRVAPCYSVAHSRCNAKG